MKLEVHCNPVKILGNNKRARKKRKEMRQKNKKKKNSIDEIGKKT